MNAARREALILGAAGIAAAVAGFLAGPALLRLGEDDGAALLGASFPDLQGRPRRLAEWNGKILVCNFWATWCAPCREEIPLLIAAREKFHPLGLEVVGIAIDNAAKVFEFSALFKISYPIVQAEANGIELMHRLGNLSGGLPYTVVTDRKGKLAYRKLGSLRQPELDETLGKLVQG